MADYEFCLKYRLPMNIDGGLAAEALGAAGCTDAVLGIGVARRLALAFEREAQSAIQAISSAVEDVGKALPQADLIEVQPDLVGISEIAELVGVSRQNMRKLMVGTPLSPLPAHDGSTALWHLVDVLDWLVADKAYPQNACLRETAKAAFQVNLDRTISRHQEAASRHSRLVNA